jgi:hypothetical protein
MTMDEGIGLRRDKARANRLASRGATPRVAILLRAGREIHRFFGDREQFFPERHGQGK